MPRIESLLAARLFLAPQLVGDRIYFLSNLSGRLSLYVMDHGGSVPEPLLPPEELLLLLHAVLVCTAGSVPGGEGSQVRRGISV